MRVETTNIPDTILDRYWDWIAECVARSSPRDTFTARMYDEPAVSRAAQAEPSHFPGSIRTFSVAFELREWCQGTDRWLVVAPHTDKDVRILQYLAGERDDAE